MFRNKKLALGTVLSVILTSCGSMGIVSTPSEYIPAGQEVSAKKENINILGLTAMDTGKTSGKLLEDLKGKCPNGLTNIRTNHDLKNLLIFNLETLTIYANCKN